MHQSLPLMAEHADTLKQRLPREHAGRKQPRLQMLSLLASGPAHTRREVAQLLGGHRHTMGHWLALYEAGGLEALLALYMPAGTPLARAPAGLAAMEQALRQPAGFAACEALRPWVQQTQHLEVHDHTLSTMVRTRFKATLKVPRPRHTKNPCGHSCVAGDL
jgi:DNA-binding transcriptional ArsR family regulator